MQLSIGVVLILDEKATPFTRIWCCFEESIAVARLKTLKERQPQVLRFEWFINDESCSMTFEVEERNAGMPLLLDVAATDSANEAKGTNGAQGCGLHT